MLRNFTVGYATFAHHDCTALEEYEAVLLCTVAGILRCNRFLVCKTADLYIASLSPLLNLPLLMSFFRLLVRPLPRRTSTSRS